MSFSTMAARCYTAAAHENTSVLRTTLVGAEYFLLCRLSYLGNRMHCTATKEMKISERFSIIMRDSETLNEEVFPLCRIAKV